MKKSMLKVISVILTILMTFSVFSAIIYAEDGGENDIPTIFVDGIASSPIVNTQSGASVFPPSAGSIVSGVSKALVPFVKSILRDDYSQVGAPLSEAVVEIFDGIACNEDGNPIYPTSSAYTYPTLEQMKDSTYSSEVFGSDTSDYIWYSYDWRLDIATLATGLHEFIEYVLEETGASKVNLIGFSMGTCVVATYMHDYDYEYVNNVVYLAGGYNGTSTGGEPFSNRLGFDSQAMVRFINTMLGENFGGYMVKAIIDALYQMGIFDSVLEMATDLMSAAGDDIYELAFRQVFAKIPGLWSLIPYDMYDDAKEVLIDGNVSDEYLAKIDYYHDEIQGNNDKIISGAMERGINVAIIAKYGSTVPPCIESINNIGDSVIDLIYTSYGAVCATADTTLGEDYVQAVNDGHNHLSPDGLVDASTCKFPEITWFVKGLNHSDHNDAQWKLCDYILDSETQPDIFTDEAYPQFLIYIGDELVPLTAENDYSKLEGVTQREEGIFARLIHVIKIIIEAFKSIFG